MESVLNLNKVDKLEWFSRAEKKSFTYTLFGMQKLAWIYKMMG